MWELGRIVFLGTMAGAVGTGAGALILALGTRPKDWSLGFLLGLSSGVMLAVVFQDLLPEAVALGGLTYTLLGVFFGVAALTVMIQFIPHEYFEKRGLESAGLIKAGILLGLGIALHNLPEGLAIGAGYVASENLGISLAVALSLHNIPEGMAMSAALLAGGLDKTKVVLWSIITGIPTGLGALGGALFGTLSANTLAGALGFAGGAMLFLVFQELLPQASLLGRPYATTFGAIAGICVGLVFLFVL